MEEIYRVSAPCRDMRHAWEVAGDAILIEQNGQIKHFSRTLSCNRCGTERIDEFRVSRVALAKVRSQYRYVPGYQVKGGVSVEAVRLQLFANLRMISKEDHEMIPVEGDISPCCGASIEDGSIVHRPHDRLCYSADAEGVPV